MKPTEKYAEYDSSVNPPKPLGVMGICRKFSPNIIANPPLGWMGDVDDTKISGDEIFDGKYVLLTNTDLHQMEVAIQYKQRWTVEDIFRTMKSILDTRPIFHKCDDSIRGHIFCSFLALCMRKKLFEKLEKRKLRQE